MNSGLIIEKNSGKLSKYFSRKRLRRRNKSERIPIGVRGKIYAYLDMLSLIC